MPDFFRGKNIAFRRWIIRNIVADKVSNGAYNIRCTLLVDPAAIAAFTDVIVLSLIHIYAAQSLELTGWVENEDDGSVTLEVQGDPVKFRKLFALIQRSDYIQITAIRQKDIAPDPWERGFSVRGY